MNESLTYYIYNNITGSIFYGPASGGNSIEEQTIINTPGDYQFRLKVIDSNNEHTNYTYQTIYTVLHLNNTRRKYDGKKDNLLFALYILYTFLILLVNKVYRDNFADFYGNTPYRFHCLVVVSLFITCVVYFINIYYYKFFLFLLLFLLSCTYLIKSFNESIFWNLISWIFFIPSTWIWMYSSPIETSPAVLIGSGVTLICMFYLALFTHVFKNDNNNNNNNNNNYCTIDDLQELEKFLLLLLPVYMGLIIFQWVVPISDILQIFIGFLVIILIFMVPNMVPNQHDRN